MYWWRRGRVNSKGCFRYKYILHLLAWPFWLYLPLSKYSSPAIRALPKNAIPSILPSIGTSVISNGPNESHGAWFPWLAVIVVICIVVTAPSIIHSADKECYVNHRPTCHWYCIVNGVPIGTKIQISILKYGCLVGYFTPYVTAMVI